MSLRHLAVLLAASLLATATPNLKVSVDGPTQVTDINDFPIRATVRNTGDETLKLYNEPQGVLTTTPAQSFKVSRANGNGGANFIGLTAKYSFEHATSFTTLAPGESTTIEHQVSHAYSFESGGEGSYDITPLTTFYYQDPVSGQPVQIQAEFEQPHTAKISGTLKSRHMEKRRERYEALQKRSDSLEKRTTQFANCTAAVEEKIQASAYVASLYVADAEKYLTLHTEGTPRFTQWFGTYQDSHHSTVLDHYSKIRKSDVKTYTYDCACEEGSDIYAYVFPDRFGHVYLCNQYMLAEISGTDSKAGTIVHESSHFTANAGTDDIAYGQTGAGALAQTNSSQAIMNADSHEYFAENTPWLA